MSSSCCLTLVYVFGKSRYKKAEHVTACRDSSETTEHRALQNHVGLIEARAEMWGFYPHCIHRDMEVMQQALSFYQIFTRGETHCITQIPKDPSKTLCAEHQYRYNLFFKINRRQSQKCIVCSQKGFYTSICTSRQRLMILGHKY